MSRSKPSTSAPARVQALLDALDALTPEATREIEGALSALGLDVPWSRVRQALQRRDFTTAAHVLMAAVAGKLPQLDEAVRNVTTRGLDVGAQQASARLGLSFRMVSPHAVEYARTRAGLLVREVTRGLSSTLQAQLQALVVESQQGGLTVQGLARRIRPLIGLDPRRAAAFVNYRDSVFAGTSGRPLTDKVRAVLDARVERYGRRLLSDRARTIARTEVLAAGNEGTLASWREAARNRTLPPGRVKRWIATGDDLLCPKCRPWHRAVAALDAPFGNGRLVPPLHPQCRCCVTLVRDPRLGKVTP